MDRWLACPRIENGLPALMGILNVTPDSFSDGGAFGNLDEALRHAERMVEEGANIIDVGGESTRPRGSTYGEGAALVNEEEEIRRVLPIIDAMSRRFPEVTISIDTYKAGVAARAIDAGASVINDVTGLRQGIESAEIAARSGAAMIVMHAIGRPGEMTHSGDYRDVVREVTGSLARSVAVARAAGVRSVAVDPGFGFGKTPMQNLRLMNHLDALHSLHCPVMIGVSRKSTIGSVLSDTGDPRPVGERLNGTLGVTAVAVLRGAGIVRTHDVRETRDFLIMLRETLHA
jgi:dihydropteroate synthase